MFGFDRGQWEKLNGLNTATEIFNQPDLWIETLNIIESNQEEISKFVKAKIEKENLRIIFTGAGTSAYVGEILTPFLNKKRKWDFQAIPSTDIVANPEMYLKKDIPTIMVSFARSGNSPESIASYNLANKLIDDISHVFITCNKEGELANISDKEEDILLLLMPEESNDKGFAMTSSFSCMTIAALLLFDWDNLGENKDQLLETAKLGKEILNNGHTNLDELIEGDFNRVVYLGSGTFYGLAKESSLKLLELTRGQIISHSETILGFRHGPKSIVNDGTYIFVYISDKEYPRKYDVDLINEMYHDLGKHKITTIGKGYSKDIENVSEHHIYINNAGEIDNEVFIGLLYVLYAQIFALLSSVKLGVEPDNPSPTGTVNRVVKGVAIYDYK
ncbi:tagatose-6-phosphate ketose/aldose isomerase [[Clostridium] ultunense Esp]|uniref:Tagatose-6-phosphate ketose/aldose isomerase n=1 Tax=[Clostridium] ultunense Esp TaxID=1288971 RepID=M1ZKT8_9FIRM|nr:SIS domain-containing protein [Schnuerera ultunensis]CCQ96027.1 tagatose-6-phosphate ketose/aldose isomerase [[Clostridium] ultunense Esp]SHD76921.1 tagatose-6-phosphate ketose/aldose isomerase [[Clostridium] ultunense Esp]